MRSALQVPAELAEKNIIFNGSDDADYVNEWMPQLHRAIEDLNFTGQSDRNFQMSHLSRIVSTDLREKHLDKVAELIGIAYTKMEIEC